MTVRFFPWELRGIDGIPVWQVSVEIVGSHSISPLIAAKRRLNNPPVRGLVLVENRSRALARLGEGWKEMDHGLWYKIFP